MVRFTTDGGETKEVDVPQTGKVSEPETVSIAPLQEDKIHSDVCFIVGADKSFKVEGHRALLANASKYFEKILAPAPNAPRNLQQVELPDVRQDVFMAVLDCIYRGTTNRITSENLAACFEAAQRFQVVSFHQAVANFVESGENLTPSSIISVLGSFQSLTSNEAEYIWRYFEQHADIIITLPNFSNTPAHILQAILRRSFLGCSEFAMYNAVMKWGKAECARQQLPSDTATLRAVLNKYLPLIRFPTMELKQLKQVEADGVLDQSDFDAVFKYAQVLSGDASKHNSESKDFVYSTVHRSGSDSILNIQTVENRFRAMFAKGVQCGKEADVLLINVYENEASFMAPNEAEYNNPAAPLLLNERRPKWAEGSTINDELTFMGAWSHFTLGELDGLDWTGLAACGGSVLANLIRNDTVKDYVAAVANAAGGGDEGEEEDEDAEHGPLNDDLIQYFHNAMKDDGDYGRDFYYEPAYSRNPFKFMESDVDLYFIGLSEDEAMKKIEHILSVMRRNIKSEDIIVLRTSHAITFVPPWPFPHVQCILRSYQSISEVLFGFDLDSVCFAFDGTSVYATPRGRNAIRHNLNFVDATRQSTTYESRLYKYSNRGFAVAVPGFAREQLDLSFLSRSVTELRGLAKLLRLHDVLTSKHSTIRDVRVAKAEMDGSDYDSSSPWILKRPFFNNEYSLRDSMNKLTESGRVVPFLYKKVPVGRNKETLADIFDATTSQHYSSTLPAVPEKQEKPRNNYFYYRNPEPTIRKDVVEELAKSMQNVTDKFYWKSHLICLPPKIRFITQDPGRQYSGSFHPLSGDWFADAYGANVPKKDQEGRNPFPPKNEEVKEVIMGDMEFEASHEPM